MSSDKLPVSAGGRPAPPASPSPPPVASTRDGTAGCGGRAGRPSQPAGLCWWACRRGSLSKSARSCGPGLGGQQPCPSAGRHRGHRGTRGEADGDLKGPPMGCGHPAEMSMSRWAVSLGGSRPPPQAQQGRRAPGKGGQSRAGGGGPTKAGPCPQREGRAGAEPPRRDLHVPGTFPWAILLTVHAFPQKESAPER